MISIHNIAEKYTPEMALFVLVCRLAVKQATPADVAAFLSDFNIDWVLFYRIVATHQLRPIVYRALSGISVQVDPRFFNKLKQDALRIASGNLVKLDEMLKLHEVLSTAGIANIPYKGVLLSQFLYNDFVTRETADIDIMIKARDIGTAYEVLVVNGYKPAYFFDARLVNRLAKTESELLFIKETPAGPVKVEIHWEVAHAMLHVPVSVDQLFSNAKSQSLLDKTIQVLDARDLVLILMAHHGVNDVWRTFRHVADVAALIEREKALLGSVEMNSLLTRYGLRKTSAIGVQLCHDLFGVGASTSMSTTPEYQVTLDNLLSATGLDRYKLSAGNVRRQFMLRDSFAHKLHLALAYVKVALTPNIRDVETLRLPRSLHFLYYFLKPFLFLARR